MITSGAGSSKTTLTIERSSQTSGKQRCHLRSEEGVLSHRHFAGFDVRAALADEDGAGAHTLPLKP
jgi:hypothetical protein